jgi:hypothetical protein
VEHIISRTLSFMLAPYLFVLSMIGIGFSVFVIGTAAFAQKTSQADSFAAFADIFPGQPESAIDGHEFLCFSDGHNFYRSPFDGHCILHPESGTFSSIEVTNSQGTIHQITFLFHDRTFQLGDLALFLGSREFRPNPHTAFFSWRGNLGLASTVGGLFSLFSPVWQVTFTDTPLS